MKLIFHFIILLGLFSACHTQSYIYRKPVIGLVYDKIPLTDVSIVYNSSDALSPQNIISNKEGRFILPKIEMDNYADFISSVKGINSIILIKKKGYVLKKIDLKKYDTGKDTIRVGIIHLEKAN
jgi:hypothetical protein